MGERVLDAVQRWRRGGDGRGGKWGRGLRDGVLALHVPRSCEGKREATKQSAEEKDGGGDGSKALCGRWSVRVGGGLAVEGVEVARQEGCKG